MGSECAPNADVVEDWKNATIAIYEFDDDVLTYMATCLRHILDYVYPPHTITETCFKRDLK